MCGDDGEMEQLREALGAIAVAPPALYLLHPLRDGSWRFACDGRVDPRSFPTLDAALSAIRRAALRRTSYDLAVAVDPLENTNVVSPSHPCQPASDGLSARG